MATLIVFPTPQELKRFKSQLGNWKVESFDSHLGLFFVTEKDLFLSTCGMGKEKAEKQSLELLNHLKSKGAEIKSLICCGAAGALDPTLSCGDIVVSSNTVEHDTENMPTFSADRFLVDKFANVDFRGYKILTARIASGDENIIDRDRADELAKKTQARAVAWEGAGVARAARDFTISFNEVRAITDLADRRAKMDFENNLSLAMKNLAHAFTQFF